MRFLSLIMFLYLSPLTLIADEVKQGDFIGNKNSELPNWFKATFLDFTQDLAEAKAANRHIMIYFHQNGCPYCAKLVEENFHNKTLVAKLNQNFDVIETNMWGDRELTDWQSRDWIEKEFSAFMKIQFTPTLVFLDAKGNTVLRINGYQSIEKMHKTLDYVADKKYLQQSFAQYIEGFKKNKIGVLNKNSLFASAPHILSRSQKLPAQTVLAVFFEEPNCSECNAFHQNIIALEQTKKLLEPMTVVQFNALSDDKLITPAGMRSTAKKWYDDLKLTYKPAVVLFDKYGVEIIRADAFFKTYHFQSILTYAQSGAFKQQPNFQRYLEQKSDAILNQGIDINIWK